MGVTSVCVRGTESVSWLVVLDGGVLIGVDAQEPKDLIFSVATVTTRVDANGGKFAAFTPTFDG